MTNLPEGYQEEDFEEDDVMIRLPLDIGKLINPQIKKRPVNNGRLKNLES